ncbi:MAG TPA: M48 family metallopeptidase [Armatimonadota bacterium]|nr:M48 family metallopeptidase [Armatimonadota bacterium]
MYEAIRRNKWRSFFLVFFLTLFLLVVGYVFGHAIGKGEAGGIGGLGIAGILAIVMALVSYYGSDRIVLAISSAREVTREEQPRLYYAVESLSLAAGIPPPRAFIIEDSAPNAFATGRDPEHGVICVTTGLLDKLDKLELEGVIAHELAHIRNRDVMFMSMVVVMVGVIALLSDLAMRYFFWGGGRRRGRGDSGGQAGAIILVAALLLAVLAPVIAGLIRMAISRKRELLADAEAAKITRYPKGLADALRKLEYDTEPLEAANKATAHMYIVNPLKDLGGFVNGLYSTHPPIAERVNALMAM